MLRTQSPTVGFSHGWLSKKTTLHPLTLSFKYLLNRKLCFPSWGFQVSETEIWENLANFKCWGLKNQASNMPFQIIQFFKYTLVIGLFEFLMSCCQLWIFLLNSVTITSACIGLWNAYCVIWYEGSSKSIHTSFFFNSIY